MSPSHRAKSRGRAVLVTGATGLVGNELLDQMRHSDAEVVGVSRRGRPTDPDIVPWDMASEPPPAKVGRRWDMIIHTAANTRWTMQPDEAEKANVGTVRALEPLIGPDTHLIHVSTAYALGLNGAASDRLDDFRNTYEWSKAKAEQVARELCDRVTVVRPPLIIGRRKDGRAARFAGMYTLVRGLTVGTVPAIVADPEAPFDALPVDDLAQMLGDLAQDSSLPSKTTLTIAGGSQAPTVTNAIEAIVDSLNSWRARHDVPPLSPLPLITPESWDRFFRPFAEDHLSSRQLLILGLLESFAPYLALSSPLPVDRQVENVLPCICSSTNFWAETNPRLAARTPRPWSSPRQAAQPASEVTRCP